jgi:hypothetical protein
MAVRRLLFAVAAVLCARAASSQSVFSEVTQTVGTSTERISAAATQARVLGERDDVQFSGELAWADRSEGPGDAFGAAYPYSDRVQVMEAYAERTFRPGPVLLGVQAGRYRTPFGIFEASDHAYTGFLRAPLIRYDNYYALSNNFFEHGGSVVVGIPRLSVEVSAGAPGDAGVSQRRPTLDTVIRGQGAIGPFILGTSYIHTNPYQPATFAHGRAIFTGLDVRFMRGGVQARGEWISGQPFDGTTTHGGYADLIVHRPFMGAVTGILRAEHLAYVAPPPYALYGTRYTAGVRIRLFQQFTAVMNVLHQSKDLPEHRPTSLDVGLTYTKRFTHRS